MGMLLKNENKATEKINEKKSHAYGEAEKYKRPRTNSEETAMILTCMSKGMIGTESFSSESEDENQIRGFEPNLDSTGSHSQISTNGNNKISHVQEINREGTKLDFTDNAGNTHSFKNESNRVKSLVTKQISIDELRAHFDRPIIDVAKDFGICITLMKKICRRNGIKRWPHRQIRSLSKSIASMEAAMLSAHGAEREKYRHQIEKLKMKRESVIADPNKENSVRVKTEVKESTQRAPLHIPSEVISKISPRNGAFITNVTPSSSTSNSKGGRWTSEEHAAFLEGIRLYGKDWRRVSKVVMTRSAVQTRTHAQKYLLKFAGRISFGSGEIMNHEHYISRDNTVAGESEHLSSNENE
jgi:SHAQKYF class myb-like DNA-binding protein